MKLYVFHRLDDDQLAGRTCAGCGQGFDDDATKLPITAYYATSFKPPGVDAIVQMSDGTVVPVLNPAEAIVGRYWVDVDDAPAMAVFIHDHMGR
jgi:hypothetical protein